MKIYHHKFALYHHIFDGSELYGVFIGDTDDRLNIIWITNPDDFSTIMALVRVGSIVSKVQEVRL